MPFRIWFWYTAECAGGQVQPWGSRQDLQCPQRMAGVGDPPSWIDRTMSPHRQQPIHPLLLETLETTGSTWGHWLPCRASGDHSEGFEFSYGPAHDTAHPLIAPLGLLVLSTGAVVLSYGPWSWHCLGCTPDLQVGVVDVSPQGHNFVSSAVWTPEGALGLTLGSSPTAASTWRHNLQGPGPHPPGERGP